MSLALSKTADPADLLGPLADVVKHVDATIAATAGQPGIREQHPMRRWEYAIALTALQTWAQQVGADHGAPYIYDVGGAGSPFHYMVPYTTRVIDPDAPDGWTLEAWLQQHPRLASCVFCLSVLEHVEDLDRFLYHLGCLVAPGGLLVLTMDYCYDVSTKGPGNFPPDTYHFSWMRKRIVGPLQINAIAEAFARVGFHLLTERDYAVRPPAVYDYTFASLCLVKRP